MLWLASVSQTVIESESGVSRRKTNEIKKSLWLETCDAMDRGVKGNKKGKGVQEGRLEKCSWKAFSLYPLSC